MTTLTNTEYKGKKAHIGNVCFDDHDKLCIFVCYCDNCHGKVLLTREEADLLSNRYRHCKNNLRTRLALKLVSDLRV